MNETLASLRRLRRALVPRQALDNPRGELDRVDHLPLRRTRMDAVALDPDADLRSREGLVVDTTDLRAVEGVREVRAEFLDVEVLDAAPDFLVDGEADADRSVLDLRASRKVRDRAHDLRDAGLVVRTKQRRAVGRDDVVPCPLREDRVLARTQDLARVAGEDDVAAVIVANDLGLHIRARFVGARVDMGDQPDGRAR